MTMFPTASAMRAIAGPVVADAALQLGSRCDLYRETAVEQEDASFEHTPALITSTIPVRLTMISSEKVREIFGEIPAIVMSGSMTRVAVVTVGDILKVAAGDFINTWLRVVKVIENALSDSYTLGLAYREPVV